MEVIMEHRIASVERKLGVTPLKGASINMRLANLEEFAEDKASKKIENLAQKKLPKEARRVAQIVLKNEMGIGSFAGFKSKASQIYKEVQSFETKKIGGLIIKKHPNDLKAQLRMAIGLNLSEGKQAGFGSNFVLGVTVTAVLLYLVMVAIMDAITAFGLIWLLPNILGEMSLLLLAGGLIFGVMGSVFTWLISLKKSRQASLKLGQQVVTRKKSLGRELLETLFYMLS
jgi:hypothetical protein